MQHITLRLVEIAYQRRPSFRTLREPFRLGMLFFSTLYRIDPNEYEVRTPQCRGCMRFRKLALKERSSLFRSLNSFFNPIFDRHLERIVTEEGLQEAKEYVGVSTGASISTDDNAIGGRLTSS